jgi:hypothetical protein
MRTLPLSNIWFRSSGPVLYHPLSGGRVGVYAWADAEVDHGDIAEVATMAAAAREQILAFNMFVHLSFAPLSTT